jgi:hypothetical protein
VHAAANAPFASNTTEDPLARSSRRTRHQSARARRLHPALSGFFSFLLALAIPASASAWGAIGHRMVAETAAILVEDEGTPLGALLARHRFELGVYSFLPDASFRHQDGGDGKREAPLHYLSMDALGDARAQLHRPWATAQAALLAQEASKTEPLGRLPWRAEQLFDLAAERWRDVNKVTGTYQRGTTATGDAARVFDALYWMGVMAHYGADAAVPHHASADANSFGKGQGGLHFYFEGPCVNALEPDLSARVLARARRERAAIAKALHVAEGPVESVLRLLADSAKALARVEALDRKEVLVGPPLAPGSKVSAERKPARVACKAFSALLEERLAKASVLTAELWKQTVPRTIDWSQADGLQFSDLHGAVWPAWTEAPTQIPAQP